MVQQAQRLTIVVDGVEVPARPGQTVIQAAMEAGIYIPYLCYWPGMKPYGACRMCLVEVEGQRGTPASCTLPVRDGMVVKTNTPLVQSLRREILEFLLSEHPHGCLTCHRVELCGPGDVCLRHVAVTDRCVFCPKNERCEFKDTVRSNGMELETPLHYHYRNIPIETRDPFYDRDYNLCIVCGRCVRVCQEVRGDDAICMVERSGTALVGTSFGTSLLESGCEFCGACVDVCPVGALVERRHKWEKAVDKVRTVCPHCPVGCQVILEVGGRKGGVSDTDTHPWRLLQVLRPVQNFNRLVRSVGDWTAHNRGQLCFKGKFGLEFPNRGDRLTRPLVRRDGQLQEATWEEALEAVARGLERYRNGAFALVVSPRATNEEAYLAGKFARAVMGTNSVDIASNTRPELVEPVARALGMPSATGSVWDLEGARCALVVNANITEDHNVAAVPLKKASREGALRLVVVDPREVELTRYSQVWLRPRPGTEPLLLAGLLRSLLDQGLEDGEFLQAHTEGLEGLRRSLEGVALGAVARETGVPVEEISAAARLLATSRPAAFIYSLDNLTPEGRLSAATALVDLALVTGNPGWLFPLRPGANEQGAWDVGCTPGLLPGHRPVDDPQARSALEGAWSCNLPREPGVGAVGLASAIAQGRVKALWLVGESPSLHNGELPGLLEALEGLEFLVVSATFLDEAARRASVVLPATTFAEEEGTYTSLERRVQRLRPALRPRGQERPHWWALCQVARRMGAGGFNYSSPAEVWEEVRGLVPFYAGITYQRLEEGGLQWPCPAPEHPGTPSLSLEGLQAQLLPLPPAPPPPPQPPDYPFLFVPGRVLLQQDRGAEVVRVNGRNAISREEWVEIHPEDAADLGLAEGVPVEVVTPQGRSRGVARLTGRHRGVVSATTLFGQLAVELDRSQEPDPMLRTPPLRVLPARVERAGA